jgi:hypothetical protein
MYRQAATIKGRGEFPVDMLRYDRACPYSETDSYTIRNAIAQGDGHEWTISVVRYVSTKDQKWTIASWQSFGVSIIPGLVEKL